MATISLCMIVRDEEAVLARCLDSIAGLVDEVVIADTGSSDSTRRIAEQYTGHVYEYAWRDHFSEARNFALSKASCDYCMWMDADDILPQAYASAFQKMKESLPADVDVVMMPYYGAFDESGKPVLAYYRERIVRNSPAYRFLGRVHEAISPFGNIRYVEIPVEHRRMKAADSGRNLRIYTNMITEGIPFTARDLYYYGRELYYHGQYEEGEKALSDFLGREDGWIENKIDATRILAYCLYHLGRDEEALGSLLWGLSMDVPRAETCCDLGRHFLDRNQLSRAKHWFMQALQAEKQSESGAFIQEDCYGYYPAVSLCVCCCRMGDFQEALTYHKLAKSYRPDAKACLENDAYFRRLAENNMV